MFPEATNDVAVQTHAASQDLPSRRLETTYDGEPSESCEKSV